MTGTPNDDRQVDAARIAVERARARLMGSAHELQDRLSPKTLARGAWEGAKDKGADLAEDAVDAVRARPYAAGGAVAALTVFLARAPLIDLAARLFGRKRTAKKTRKPAAKKAAPASKTETA
ncbi:MAG: DUF3618 domain-containing protein [Sphingomicrobium sp.]